MLVNIRNGMDLNVEISGQGPPMLLLHGNGEDHHIFDTIAEKLQQQFTLYAVDSREHGKSTKTGTTFNYDDMAEDIHLLINQLGLKEVNIVGFSDGGIIALLLGIRQEVYLNKIASLSPNLSPKDWKKKPLRYLEQKYKETRDPAFYLMLNEPNIDPEALKNIQIPSLITAGEKDLFYRSMYKTIEKKIPDAILKIIEGHDHSSYIIDSDLLSADFIHFFEI
ncbi:alpha/beta hydrolase fold [Marinilactibacillus piezotolerans]|uniref:Alpha/beta hydrolase fold n=1 Tax=Marinilactibacillus piezotolerans TaxID=258723 RepID=A0A1I4A327_9LACT|nr:alpha/beta hydrolase [Marinilactibacillus piezotolerans]SFK50497.1 alpha/beta hydrolase fold [Marinilactibacillus piezotolerans]